MYDSGIRTVRLFPNGQLIDIERVLEDEKEELRELEEEREERIKSSSNKARIRNANDKNAKANSKPNK